MKISSILIIILITTQSAFAQIYPYVEDFNSMAPFGAPNGWITSTPGFIVYPDHGNGSQGMSALLSSGTLQEDSAVSPLIGPITALSALSFQFRIMDSVGYPCCGHVMTSGDAVEFYATSGPLALLLLTIDSTTHITDTAFTMFSSSIGGLSGQVGKLMIKVRRGSGSFYVDFDNISIANASSIGAPEAGLAEPVVFPNPASDGMRLQIKNVPPDNYRINLISSSGSMIDIEQVNIHESAVPLINTRQLDRGLYFLQLTGVHNNFLLRFVVKN